MKKGFWRTVDSVIAHSDIVIEVVDARFPREGRNRDIEKLVRRKGRRLIVVFTKADLIPKGQYLFPKDVENPVLLSAKKGFGMSRLRALLKELTPKNTREKPKVGIVGYPNSGKSSLINRLSRRIVVRTSSEPGFTKGQQYVSMSGYMLVDTPGVIPRGEEDDMKHLKMVSTLLTNRDAESAAYDLMDAYPGLIEEFFGVKKQEDHNETLEAIAVKKNLIAKGGVPDTQRTAQMILHLWQTAKITP